MMVLEAKGYLQICYKHAHVFSSECSMSAHEGISKLLLAVFPPLNVKIADKSNVS